MCGSQLGVTLPPMDTWQGLGLQPGQGAAPDAEGEARDTVAHSLSVGQPHSGHKVRRAGLRSAVVDERLL